MCQSPSHSGVLIVCIANTGILGISVMNLKLRLMLMDSYSTFSTTAKTKEEIKRNNLQCRIYVLKRHICLNHTRQKNLYLWFSFVKSLASSHTVGSKPQRNQYILYSSLFFFLETHMLYMFWSNMNERLCFLVTHHYRPTCDVTFLSIEITLRLDPWSYGWINVERWVLSDVGCQEIGPKAKMLNSVHFCYYK